MKEYIEREQAIALFYPVDPENDGSDGCTIVYKSGDFSSSEIEAMLSDLPAADVAEVRHAEWKYYHKQNKAVCTNCSFERDLDTNFGRAVTCPNCGALIEGGRA